MEEVKNMTVLFLLIFPKVKVKTVSLGLKKKTFGIKKKVC